MKTLFLNGVIQSTIYLKSPNPNLIWAPTLLPGPVQQPLSHQHLMHLMHLLEARPHRRHRTTLKSLSASFGGNPVLILIRKTLWILMGFYLAMRLLHVGLFCRVTPWEEEHILTQWDLRINLTRYIDHHHHPVGLAPGEVLREGFTIQEQVVG